MLKSLLLKIALSFVVRQLSKFKETVDWDKIKADADKRVRDLLPGSWFDDQAASFINDVINIFKESLSDKDKLKKILESIAAGHAQETITLLKEILLHSWKNQETRHIIASLPVTADFIVP